MKRILQLTFLAYTAIFAITFSRSANAITIQESLKQIKNVKSTLCYLGKSCIASNAAIIEFRGEAPYSHLRCSVRSNKRGEHISIEIAANDLLSEFTPSFYPTPFKYYNIDSAAVNIDIEGAVSMDGSLMPSHVWVPIIEKSSSDTSMVIKCTQIKG